MENVDTIIGANVKIKGSVKNPGSIQVNGTIEGEIRSEQLVTIGETAVVSGPIQAKIVEISGLVKGVINASEKVDLNPKAQVTGDIITKILIIKQGAIFNGKSQMTEGAGQVAQEPESEKK